MYILTLEAHKISSKFGRNYKYDLGSRIREKCYEALDLIVKINSLPDMVKIEKLSELDIRKEEIIILLRLGFDLKEISAGQSEILNKKLQEIGLQIGGWQKWLKRN